jgi:hypothetical protein
MDAHEASHQYRRVFAHRLVSELGVSVIYGHSSHHIRGFELFNGKLIMYGAGDLIGDIEVLPDPQQDACLVIGGLLLASVDGVGNLTALQLIPMFMNRLRLRRVKDTCGFWNSSLKCMQHVEGCGKMLQEFVNEMSELDAESNAINFRVQMDNEHPILVWP